MLSPVSVVVIGHRVGVWIEELWRRRPELLALHAKWRGDVGSRGVLVGAGGQPGLHSRHHLPRQPPHEDAAVPGNGNEVATIIGEREAGDQLRVAGHGRHQLPGVIVVDGEGLVCARGGAVDPRPVQHHLDQGSVLGGRSLECLGLLGT